MRVVGGIDGIAFVHFDERDVVRHKLVQMIVRAYEANGPQREPRLASSASKDSVVGPSTGSGSS